MMKNEETKCEDMSLAEHDLRYHDNNYRGGACQYRDKMKSGDDSDDSLNAANEKESVIYGARRYEGKMVENAVYENFDFLNAKNSRIQLLEPDVNGNNQLMIQCGATVGDEKVPAEKIEKMMKKLGYELLNFTIMESKPQGVGKHLAKPKKEFLADVRRKDRQEEVRYADPNASEKDAFTYRKEGSGELDDTKKSEILKKFGVKSEGGVVRKRTISDAQKDRMRKYLGITGDFEGQSNREDRATKKWDEAKAEARKRAIAAHRAEFGV